jgi:hypothetical protein
VPPPWRSAPSWRFLDDHRKCADDEGAVRAHGVTSGAGSELRELCMRELALSEHVAFSWNASRADLPARLVGLRRPLCLFPARLDRPLVSARLRVPRRGAAGCAGRTVGRAARLALPQPVARLRTVAQGSRGDACARKRRADGSGRSPCACRRLLGRADGGPRRRRVAPALPDDGRTGEGVAREVRDAQQEDARGVRGPSRGRAARSTRRAHGEAPATLVRKIVCRAATPGRNLEQCGSSRLPADWLANRVEWQRRLGDSPRRAGRSGCSMHGSQP